MKKGKMNNRSKLGLNIRALRVAYGESQEELGDILGFEKNTISSYETGLREPSKQTLADIAKHYMVSVDEIMLCDLSFVGKITVDENAFWKNIELIFPVLKSERALKNQHFEKAYMYHKEFFEHLRNSDFEGFLNIDECVEEYINAYEDEDSKEEASANFIAIMILTCMILKITSVALKNKPAALIQVATRNPEAKRIIEDYDPDFEKEANELLTEFGDSELREYMLQMKKNLKKAATYSDLVDYYVALEFFYGLVDNGLGPDFNRRIGAEILKAIDELDNIYARRFIQYSLDAIGMSSQTVDEK